MTTETETFDGWSIETGFLTGNLLAGWDDGLDEQASIELYRDLLTERLIEAFPGAAVKVRYQHAVGSVPFDCQTHVYRPNADYSDDRDPVVERVAIIAADLSESADWVISEPS